VQYGDPIAAALEQALEQLDNRTNPDSVQSLTAAVLAQPNATLALTHAVTIFVASRGCVKNNTILNGAWWAIKLLLHTRCALTNDPIFLFQLWLRICTQLHVR
jgi:hypothetical protein